MVKQFEASLGDSKFILETGRLAQLAGGSVTLQLGDTLVLATAVVAPKPREGIDFFPLLVDYEERFYASGKISGSRFVKREGRANDEAILAGRLIDRPLRPLFPKGFYNDVHVIVTILSADLANDPDVIGITAASAAVMLCGVPFEGPVAGIRVGRINGELIANPTYEQRTTSDLDLVLAGTESAVMMVEAAANFLTEEEMVKAIEFGHKSIQPLIAMQRELVTAMQPTPIEFTPHDHSSLHTEIHGALGDKVEGALYHPQKAARNANLNSLKQEIFEKFVTEQNPETTVASAFEHAVEREFRRNIIENGKRPDGRGLDEIRPINIEVDVLPRPHGSAIFQRGETQALSTVTLGSLEYEQVLDTMEFEGTKRYMHHYNFPPYATNEAKPLRSVGRREIGHGALAERALVPVIPSREEFPYTIRVVSEIMASNGSSSMASVCGSTLSLMAAGVPIKEPIAGVAMGLVTDGSTYRILTDILGDEDHLGDMDFKVTGSDRGITALQMDIKVTGITLEIMTDALAKAKAGRLSILDKMKAVIATPRTELSPYAPRVIALQVPVDRIGEIIGPGGRVINDIIDRAGGKAITTINIEDDGSVFVTSLQADLAEQAAQAVRDIIREITPGEKFDGTVTRIMDFGAFVEILPGKEGLVHISQLANERVEKVTDVVNTGDKLEVIVTEIDDQGRINLSHKAVLNGGKIDDRPPRSSSSRPPRGRGDRRF